MQKPRFRRLGAGLALAATAGAVLYWMRQPIDVDTAVVAAGDVVATIDEEGRTRVLARYVVSSPVAGRLDRVTLAPGDRVRAGDVLATIQPAAATPLDTGTAARLRATLEAARDGLVRAQAAETAARASAEYATAEATRAAALARAGALSGAGRENADTRAREADEAAAAAAAAVRMAEHEVEAARAALQPPARDAGGRAVVVRAPAAGTILRVIEEDERVVAPGTPVIEIGDPGRLEVIVDVLTTDAVRVREGARATFSHWGGEPPIPGRVRRIEPSTFTKVSALGVEEQRVNLVLDFADPAPPGGLGDGYSLDVHIVVDEARNVPKVPAGALFRHGTGWGTYLVREGRAHLREVEPGLRAGFDVAVTRGLEAGDRVIVYPGEDIVDGARVTAR